MGQHCPGGVSKCSLSSQAGAAQLTILQLNDRVWVRAEPDNSENVPTIRTLSTNQVFRFLLIVSSFLFQS
jgi:hypothetical protein